MDRRRLLRRLARGHLANVRFAEFRDLVEGFGFELRRIRGSHQVFAHPSIAQIIDLQERDGEAKAYQIKQFLRLVETYGLRLEDDE